MKRLFFIVSILLCCSFVQSADVNLSAAMSLKECLNEIIDLYKKAEPNTKVIPNYEASGKLVEQIVNGAPVDVFISASQEKMDIVETKQFIVPKTRKDLVTNKVVLIAPKDKDCPFVCFGCLGHDKLKDKGLAIGDPKVVPAGKYATEIFDSLEIKDKVMPKVVLAQNVRAVLTYVAQGEVDAGIVYLTDAKLMPDKVKIITKAPVGSHTPVVYPAAVTITGDNSKGGKAFLNFLFSPDAVDVFKKYGYEMAEEK